MLCPDCGFDNIEGMDSCEACGQSLVSPDPAGEGLEESISRHSIGVLCPAAPLTVEPATPVSSAIASMSEHRVGCMLVVDRESGLLGIFTERDVLTRFSDDISRGQQPVSNFMTENPATVSQDDSIGYALHAMDLGGYRHLPVVDDNDHPIGVISVRDILRFLCVQFAELRTAD